MRFSGREISGKTDMLVAMSHPRIISLVPSATETVFELGLGAALVGRSHVCNFPPEALSVPILTQPQVATESSRTIHDDVRQRLAAGLAIYALDLDQIRSLEPTHLLVQDQCSVCAVSPGDLESALADWLGDRPTLVRLAPHTLADVWRDIETVGLALDRAEAARSLRTKLSFRLSDLVESIGFIEDRPRVASVEWLAPLMIAGHWVPELVRLAGGEPLLAQSGGPSRTVDLDTLERSRPDVIVIQACGFDRSQTRREWNDRPELGTAFRGWQNRRGEPVRVALVDGDAYFNRPGPRLVDSAELLAEILHSDRPRVYEGRGWESLIEGASPLPRAKTHAMD